MREKRKRQTPVPFLQMSALLSGWLLSLSFLLPIVASAQYATFELFTTDDGLAGNNTASVTQDRQGFLWFVNDGKVHRYDGRNFEVVPADTPEPFRGLASFQDSLLFVWSEHALRLFNPQTNEWQLVQERVTGGPEGAVGFWQQLGQDPILVTSFHKVTDEAEVWQLRDRRLERVRFPSGLTLFNTYYWCDIDAAGHTYLAFRDTLYQFDTTGRVLNRTPLTNIGTDCYNLNFSFSAEGELILLANWQFFVLDRGRNRFLPHPANRFLRPGQNHLHRLLLEPNGSLWACGQDRNLVYYDAPRDTLYNFHEELKALLPNANDFKGLFKDRTGILWVDTRLGLLKVKPRSYPFDNYFQELSPTNAYYSFRGFTENAEGLICGVFYDGIACFDPERKSPSRLYPIPLPLSLFDLHADGDRLWVNGGEWLNTRTGRLESVPSPLFAGTVGDNGFFARDDEDALWWATHYQLYTLREAAAGPYWELEQELPERVLNKTGALHWAARSRKLWISFQGTLLRYDPRTGMQDRLDIGWKDRPASRIMAMEEDPRGRLWLGTDTGLVYLDASGEILAHYTVKDGLPNNFVCGLLTQGDSCLWLSTNHGLSRFHIASESFVNFYEADGLTSNEFNRKSYFKARNGRMFFGGMRGVNAFFPDEVMEAYQNRNQQARMALSSFEYTDERRDTVLRSTYFTDAQEIHLRHWDWSYQFEYALTDYSNPEEVLYSYQMEGYKDSWSVPSRFNFARFNSLPGGEYTFRVRARDSQGRWHPSELAVPLIVHPPWWTTGWAYAGYAAALIALIYFFLRYEMNRQRLKYHLDLEKLEAERLKDLDHFKSRLFTNLTHEFRTPLTVILGMAGQIRREPKKYLDNGLRLIENNGESLLRLINQMLDLSKLESQALQLHYRQGDIVPYLRYLTESFHTYANSRNLSLRFFTNTDALVMDYDPEQLKQILTNLISNAVKFTPSGGEVTIRVTARENVLYLEVRDTGIGIAKEDLPHIFDRFYQVDPSARQEGAAPAPNEGTGIGLAHTRELVQLMEGTIAGNSTPGRGTTFSVTLPIRREAPPAEAVYKEETPSTPHPVAKGTTVTVPDTPEKHGASLPQLLIIEDNPDVVTYLKSCLADRYQLSVAYNGRIGIEMALEHIPDLIISDVMMPERDGFEVCHTLKTDECTSHIPIILLTAKADAASRLTGLRRGADAYLTKPFDREELLVRLEMLVERQKRMTAYFTTKLQAGTTDPPLPADTEETIRIEDAFIRKVKAVIEANYTDDSFGLPQLCDALHLSRSRLYRKMKALIDTSPSDFIRAYRLQQAQSLLATTDLTVSEVAWRVGYKDLAHFSRSFQEQYGVRPSRVSN